MLRSVKELRGYRIQAVDGVIGRVHTFYFDDGSWLIRYLVVDTGGWLSGRRVLLSPAALDSPDWEGQVLPVKLTRAQVENSPPVEADKPISRRVEEQLHKYFGWVPYWQSGGPVITKAVLEQAQTHDEESVQEPQLRSTAEVMGYRVLATDGPVGSVLDLICNDRSWALHYLVVAMMPESSAKRVLLAPTWIEAIDWVQEELEIGMDAEAMEQSPEFDPSAPVNREYEVRLYDYYGRPKYWTRI